MIRPDPPVNGDGTCSGPECARRRKLVPPKDTSYANMERNLTDDPFCSSRCCRDYHGIRFPSDDARTGVVKGSKGYVRPEVSKSISAMA